MLLFAIATLVPVALLGAAAILGGVWVWLAVGYITVFTYLMDRLIARTTPNAPDGEFPTGEPLSLLLALAHFALLALAIWAIGTPHLGMIDKFGALIGFGLFFGQISNPNAHELIHKPGRRLRTLGKAVYITLLFGHHASAHPLVHHIHVATDADPNSAPLGMGFWRFAIRAWRGGLIAGYHAENSLRARAATQPTPLTHPYIGYAIGTLLTLIATLLIAGPSGIAALICLAAYAQLQLLLSDYVQHYGLRRRPGPNTRPETVGPQHSWNAPHWYSSAVMLNAPRHSDHHLRPSRPYPGLHLDTKTMPTLPHSLPVMAVIALWPALWRRVMDRRVAKWQTPATA
jgi:alkane 1-monooxygenase